MKRLIYLIVLCSLSHAAWAVPARKGAILQTQPDGTPLITYQHGDEHFHWMTNEQGDWIKQDENGVYQITTALSAQEIANKRMVAPRRVTQRETPLNIAKRGLIILVNFKDVAYTTSKAEMDSMLTGKNYTRDYSYKYFSQTYTVQSEGSAWRYFYDSSYGQYDPQFDVVGPVTLSNNMSYYGGNNSMGSDKNPEQMVYDACKMVDDSVDFSLYDNDNDGVMDFVYIIYAGYGEADGGSANTIWPHQYYLSYYRYLKLDGTEIDRYACSNELDFRTKVHAGIGTFCHEFSHVLGLPDLYETTNEKPHKTLGEWSILDYGPYSNEGNTPPAYSAYERFFMGWLTPTLIVDSANITLKELQSTNTALLISENDEHNLIGNDPDTTCFYILENRQQEGWDEYLPGHGLMLTKIRYSYKKWTDNTVNNAPKNMGVDLIEADSIAPEYPKNGYLGKPGDLFPMGATEYLGIAEHPIEGIEEQNGVITFKYRGGVTETDVENVADASPILAIYNVLGQKQTTLDITQLPHGTYIVVREKGNHTIVR